eukprot:XP_001707617.1 Hypothetical protein GL50803_36451 [Giardia lamblia ATCC 50803]
MHWDIGLPIICCKSRNLMSKSLVGCIFNFLVLVLPPLRSNVEQISNEDVEVIRSAIAV